MKFLCELVTNALLILTALMISVLMVLFCTPVGWVLMLLYLISRHG